tara:strand:- start:19 stop:738 length:720 start_codon:yes stop_codon:yes gene_type:complete
MIIGIDADLGTNNKGRIFSIDSNYKRINTLYSFDYKEDLGYFESSDLVLANNGKYYGVCTRNDQAKSFIFSYDLASNQYQIAYQLSYPMNIGLSYGLAKHPNGLLYGVSVGSNLQPYGYIYSFNPSNNNFTVIHAFDSLHRRPNSGLVVGSNNKLYGSNGMRINPNKGYLYEFDLTSNSINYIYTFTGFFGTSNSNLVVDDSCIYGIRDGSYPYYGRVYQYNYLTNQFSIVHEVDVRNN